ncbi:hypothetical protein INT43_007707 [Umbelopsis isabellina]|uniref:UTP23 sensor motif region domain-containing protein n=1 Tax=Mortierella isabellina TaxID=91625 RepID=A0A8H7U995_MORIS|nr:hypothetical protein INT43_007707 [Umbelopsis isabellina]
MHSYQTAFSFRTPYQILLDGEFCQEGLKHKVYMKEVLQQTLMGPTKQRKYTDLIKNITSGVEVVADVRKTVITSCAVAELRSKGDDYTGAVIAAKRFERRRCKHVEPVSSAQCIREIIAKDNPHNYCVASQDIELRKELRKIPGVPLIHINRSVVVLEPPSSATKQKIEEGEKAKTLPNEKELQFMHKKKKELKKQAIEGKDSKGDGAKADNSKKRKRKGPKQPNPLSMKKKKKPKVAQPPTAAKKVEA